VWNTLLCRALPTLKSLVDVRLGMTEAVERYRQYASECLRLAQESADDAHKARLLEMAAAWQRLAEAATRRDEK